MVNYFKELEKPSEYYIDFNSFDSCKQTYIDIKILPFEFFEKYSHLFKMIEEYDLLFEKNKGKQLYLSPNNNHQEIPSECLYNSFINGHITSDYGLSKCGIEKLYFIKQEYNSRYRGTDFISDFKEYFTAIYDYLLYSEKLLDCSRKNIYNFLLSAKKIAKYQCKLTSNDEILFNEALSYISNYNIKIHKKNPEILRIQLPNSWYITPYNHLYNSMGPNGHKEANLRYPFDSIISGGCISDFSQYLKIAKKLLEEGYIDRYTFESYTNLHYAFTSFYPEFYFQLDEMNQMLYRTIYQKTYNPKIVKLIAGIQSAHAGLLSFFNFLKKNSSDYSSDLNFIKKLCLDEILVRCCGFHKISSECNKTITTSCINYEEELYEYIKRGWKIDFVKPIILNPSTKRLQEYSNEFLLIKKLHNNK